MRELTIIFFIILALPLSSCKTTTNSRTTAEDWTKLGSRSNGDTFHVKFSTVKKNKNFIKFELLQNNLQRQKNGAMSIVAKVDGDCGGLRMRVTELTNYKNPMGDGVINVLGPFDEEASPWIDLPSSSYQGEIIKEVCNH